MWYCIFRFSIGIFFLQKQFHGSYLVARISKHMSCVNSYASFSLALGFSSLTSSDFPWYIKFSLLKNFDPGLILTFIDYNYNRKAYTV